MPINTSGDLSSLVVLHLDLSFELRVRDLHEAFL